MINQSKVRAVCKKVLERIVPDAAERTKLDNIINFAKKSVEDELAKQEISAEVIIGGSIGKDTWLKNTHDIDFFIKFDPKYEELKIGELLGYVVKSVFPNVKVAHGSRDYYQLQYKGYDFEFVPVLNLQNPEQAKNSMDASPFHVKYVKNHSRINDIGNEIRLLKSFAKAQGAYGAESYISGISGYVSELLIIKYGGFYELLEAFENLQPKIIIDSEKHYKDTNQIFRDFPDSKIKSPVIVIDPVLKTRNAAAALDHRTFSRLLFAMRKFLRDPKESYFTAKKTRLDDLEKLSKKRGTVFVIKPIKQTDEKKDVFFAKLKKKIEQINSQLERQGIEVYDFGFVEDKELNVYFEIETITLSKYRKHFGPPVWVPADNFDAFLEKHPDAKTENTNIIVDVKREFTDVKKLVLSIIKEELNDV